MTASADVEEVCRGIPSLSEILEAEKKWMKISGSRW